MRIAIVAVAVCTALGCGKADKDTKPASAAGETAEPAKPAEPVKTAEPAKPAAPDKPAALTASVSVEFGEDGLVEFKAVGLPAVSADGALVAFAREGNDGNRGHPNLAVHVRDVDAGKDAAAVVVLAADSFDDLEGDKAKLRATVTANLAKANAALAAHQWTPLTAGEHEPSEETGDGPDPIAVEGLSVLYAEPKLTIKAGDAVLVDRAVPEWSAPKSARADADCDNGAYLETAFVSRARRVVLAEVLYRGDDMCVEPDVTYHAVRLPK